MAKNPKVAGAISLPQTPDDATRGIQFQGSASLLTEQVDIDKAISVYAVRIFPRQKIKDLMENGNHRFYRIRPSMFVLFDAVNFPDNPRQESTTPRGWVISCL